jgi:hypothetical protein
MFVWPATAAPDASSPAVAIAIKVLFIAYSLSSSGDGDSRAYFHKNVLERPVLTTLRLCL